MSSKTRLWFPVWSMNWSGGSWQGGVGRVVSPGDGCEEGWTHPKDLWVATMTEPREGLGVAGRGEKDQNWSLPSSSATDWSLTFQGQALETLRLGREGWGWVIGSWMYGFQNPQQRSGLHIRFWESLTYW